MDGDRDTVGIDLGSLASVTSGVDRVGFFASQTKGIVHRLCTHMHIHSFSQPANQGIHRQCGCDSASWVRVACRVINVMREEKIKKCRVSAHHHFLNRDGESLCGHGHREGDEDNGCQGTHSSDDQFTAFHTANAK